MDRNYLRHFTFVKENSFLDNISLKMGEMWFLTTFKHFVGIDEGPEDFVSSRALYHLT